MSAKDKLDKIRRLVNNKHIYADHELHYLVSDIELVLCDQPVESVRETHIGRNIKGDLLVGMEIDLNEPFSMVYLDFHEVEDTFDFHTGFVKGIDNLNFITSYELPMDSHPTDSYKEEELPRILCYYEDDQLMRVKRDPSHEQEERNNRQQELRDKYRDGRAIEVNGRKGIYSEEEIKELGI